MNLKSNILKLCLFATGFSGIVAEYILATLATNFLGDSIIQWAMIVSVMMFSMGVGSRLSKFFENNLIQKFIIIEFLLSIFVAFSSLFAYSFSAFSIYTGFVIYILSIIIGIFIGMEIPLVVRLNEEFESLRFNVASVIEKDYYGSLAGGLFFSFVGLPYCGLTYTPFILGFVNFIVAFVLFVILKDRFMKTEVLKISAFSGLVVLFLTSGFYFAKPIILYGEQKRFSDKIVYSEQTRYQEIIITKWKKHYWLYINGNQQLCTLDEIMYHEPLVHPAMKLAVYPKHVLILGGGDGCAAREILKYKMVEKITVVDLDPSMTELALKHPILVELNDSAFYDPKVEIINQDGYKYIEETSDYYDVIIIDLPDPKSPDLNRLYTTEFYSTCYKILRTNGIIITQAGSPYFASKAFICIDKTMKSAGFTTLPIHNQVITLGEWGWVIGSKNISQELLKPIALTLKYDSIDTQWLNNEAMQLLVTFGKGIYPNITANPDEVEINSIHNPVLYQYYLKGNWDLY